MLASGTTEEEILDDFPYLEKADFPAVYGWVSQFGRCIESGAVLGSNSGDDVPYDRGFVEAFEVVVILQAEPVLRTRSKESRQSRRGIGGDGATLIDDQADPIRGYTN